MCLCTGREHRRQLLRARWEHTHTHANTHMCLTLRLRRGHQRRLLRATCRNEHTQPCLLVVARTKPLDGLGLWMAWVGVCACVQTWAPSCMSMHINLGSAGNTLPLRPHWLPGVQQSAQKLSRRSQGQALQSPVLTGLLWCSQDRADAHRTGAVLPGPSLKNRHCCRRDTTLP